MKTLKRTLCLVLAVVMVLGTLAVSASAVKFVDDAKIEYDAAVGTMAGLGIINGKGNDIFDPDGTVTRAEAAKMITVALIGEAAAKKLPASTSFEDVAASHWAAPYIAYCVRQGIINGKSATEFDPEGNVTGVELSKMLLCALGYGKLGEYVGEGWDTNAFLKALELGFYDVLPEAYKTDVAATREEAAQIIYNALTQNGKVGFTKLLEEYTAPGAVVLAVSCAADQTVTAVEYVPATATAAAYIQATAGSYTFKADSWDLVGHKVDVYYNGTTVYFADVTTESAVVAKASALTAKDYTNYNASNIAVYTNYAANSTGAVADGDTVIYTVNATTGAKTIVAIQNPAVYTDVTITDNYVAAAGTVAAYNYADISGVVIASGNTEVKAVDAYYYGDIAYTAATKAETTKTTLAYAREIGSGSNYLEINKVAYVSGAVSLYNAGAAKLTVGGVEYAVESTFAGATDIGAANTNDVIYGQTYSFRLNAAGEICAIEVAPAAGLDYTGFKPGYVVNVRDDVAYTATVVGGSVVPVATAATRYVSVIFADGTYGTYALNNYNGLTVALADDAKIDTDVAYTAASVSGWELFKVSGTNAAVITTFADYTYAEETVATDLEKTTVAFGSAYVNAASTVVYYTFGDADSNAETPDTFIEVTVKKGAHDYAAISDVDGKVIYNNPETGTKTVAAVVYNAGTTAVVADTYYVAAYLGEGATGKMYTAYKVGATAATTLVIDGTSNFTSAGFYVTAANGVDATKTDLNTTTAPTAISSWAAAFAIDGTYYVKADASIKLASNVVIVDLRADALKAEKPVASAADLYAGVAGYYTVNATTGAVDYILLVGGGI